MTTESAASELRKTGISVIGDVRWGTHFCYFYETKQDLLYTLVQYFKAGLENKEFCLWVVTQPLSMEEAKRALRRVVPDLDRHLAEGGLEIHAHDKWYLQNGQYNPQRVLQAWREKLNQALASGYAGLRASGEGGWVSKDDWIVFCEYEKELDTLIADQRRLILCTYSLTMSSGAQIFDAARLHQMAVARRHGRWEMLEAPELKQAKAEITRLNEELEQKVEERTRELATTNEALGAEIAERKLAVEAARRAEDRIRLIINTIPTMAWSTRPDGAVDFVNQRWLDYTGLSLEEEIEEPTRPMHSEDLARVMEKWLVVKAAEEPFEDEMRLRRADGEYRWFLVRTAPLHDEQGNLVKWYGVSIDIEDRKQVEQALRESEERFRQVTETIDEVFWLSDLQHTTIFYVSPAYEKLWGRTSDSLYASPRSWTEAIHPEDRERVAQMLADPELQTAPDMVYRIIRPDGSTRWVHARGFPVRDGSGAVVRVAGIAEDITERKWAAKELEEANDQLRLLSRRLFEVQEEERRHLARELHDEIGQALTAAKINLQSVSGNGGGAIIARLQETTAILDRLLGQVRQISLDLRPSMLDDLGLVPALRSLLDQQGRRASVAVRFSAENMPEKLDPEIQTTCFRIAQEAITNAVRHANAAQIDVDLQCENGKLRLLIHDNGSGFDVESVQAQTIGLGLIGIKERTALVGGWAKIISSPNNGTTIEASLPLMLPSQG